MRSFLFAHIHWLWAVLHRLHHSIYAPWTFSVVAFIGIAQAVIGWESGELAVKALPQNALSVRDRKRYLRLVRILAVLLFPATIFVGVVNDRGQRDADTKAKDAQFEQQVTQSKLDEANARAKHYDESFQVFAKSLDPSKLTLSQYTRLLQAQQAAHAAVMAQEDRKDPLSTMSDTALRDAAIRLSQQLHSDDLQMYAVEDEITRVRQGILNFPNPNKVQAQEFNQKLSEKTGVLRDIMNRIIQQDVPLANQYHIELLKRANPDARSFPTPKPDAGSINQFLMLSSGTLDSLAHLLPESTVTQSQR